ncbi:hypothetical protein [Sphingobium sp. WCS2017Hpa-17]|uniref:hypothetical protein n=1 Tax=Sphingobium sp. WCS2017Hpa-17 TaxID=3073638 RepID=UPI002889BE2B|nr:hypothetical protein [Sphingobium sp. WCS2017Hpa-17]
MFWKRKKMVELGGSGYVYFNPDTGDEYARNHPVESGEVPEATLIRSSTPMEDALNDGVQYWMGLVTEQYKDIHRLQRENSKLLDELADLKAKRARSNGNLIPGGPKKKAAVMAERAGSVG